MPRPKLPIDEDQVRKLAALGLTQKDIAGYLGCSAATIEGRFCLAFNDGKVVAKLNTRRLMWKRAKSGSDTVLLRLDDRCFGKQEEQELKARIEALESPDVNAGDTPETDREAGKA